MALFAAVYLHEVSFVVVLASFAAAAVCLLEVSLAEALVMVLFVELEQQGQGKIAQVEVLVTVLSVERKQQGRGRG